MNLSAVGLFCEDIREERSGQLTLVGVFADNLRIPRVPGGLPKMGLYVRVLFDPRDPPLADHIIAKLVGQDGTEIELNRFDGTHIQDAVSKGLRRGSPVVGLIIHGVMSPFAVNEFGRVRAEIQIGDQTLVAGTLNFVPRDDPEY